MVREVNMELRSSYDLTVYFGYIDTISIPITVRPTERPRQIELNQN
jgi:hypothetical protein